MAGRQKVTLQQISEALHAYGGNVSAAAEHLGMARESLRKRIAAAVESGNLPPIATYRQTCHLSSDLPPIGRPARNISLATYASGLSAPRFQAGGEMNAIPQVDTGQAQGPVAFRPARPLRLKDATLHRIQQARLKLQAATGIETTDSALLEALIGARLDAWLAEQLAAAGSAR